MPHIAYILIFLLLVALLGLPGEHNTSSPALTYEVALV